MYVRRLSAVLVSGLVGYGAWYYNGASPDSTSPLTRNFSNGQTAADAAPTRNVLVIGANELHTGTFVGDGPISKTTRDDGKRVIEMMTPDQVTQRLRQSEESYFVNRGEGVVRYDLVQLPSNDPIEDDHAEKIVEVPGKTAAADTKSSDWMFWGVFDGHA